MKNRVMRLRYSSSPSAPHFKHQEIKLKKSVLSILAILLFSLISVANAADFKVGVVDLNKVMEKSPQSEAISNSLKKEFQARDQDLIAKAKQLKQLEDKLARDAAVMSAEEAKRLENDIRSRRRQLTTSRAEFREDANLRRNEAVNRLLRKVGEVVSQIGEEEKVDVILTDGVAYFNKRVDLTTKVLQRLEELHKTSK
ncbi:OmpH family outer membrane protein [Sedimenticola selenatireducens]|uniref:OmpH family outer membrane protein n=2 Tax=Sedimenticola selenatireducens TaxID=191960 RepID=UPI002AABCBD1|nr:OmpH family outer membrane protein [Sedimenticola selenatireducens]